MKKPLGENDVPFNLFQKNLARGQVFYWRGALFSYLGENLAVQEGCMFKDAKKFTLAEQKGVALLYSIDRKPIVNVFPQDLLREEFDA